MDAKRRCTGHDSNGDDLAIHLLIALECYDVMEMVIAEDFRISVMFMDVCRLTRDMVTPIAVRNNPLWHLLLGARTRGILAAALRLNPAWLKRFVYDRQRRYSRGREHVFQMEEVLGQMLAASGGILGFAMRCPCTPRLKPIKIQQHRAAQDSVIRRVSRVRQQAMDADRARVVRREALAGRRNAAVESRIAAFRAAAPNLDAILETYRQLEKLTYAAMCRFPAMHALSYYFSESNKPVINVDRVDVPAVVAAAVAEMPALVIRLDEMRAEREALALCRQHGDRST